ncbi:MAG: Gfo/Idh/MocA family oxidoreductase [Atopobiaceae bacterium]|nr:Gfo/Idh/MocA family oxidoreductase [Atopobiaceae bacterium]
MANLRFATIGTSAICELFLEAAADVEGFQYCAAYSRDMKRAHAFARTHGADLAFDSLESLAASPDIDAVYIASPNAMHAAQAELLLKSAKHVLCEKPLASHECEVNELFACAHDNGVVFMEAIRNIHDPGFALLRDKVAELGNIHTATLRFSKLSARYLELQTGSLPNVFDPRLSGGALMDLGVYCVSSMVGLFGKPQRICASGIVEDLSSLVEGSPHKRIDVTGEILCHYEGFVVNLSYGKISDNHLPSQIQGSNASLLIDSITDPRSLKLMVPKLQTGAYATGEATEHEIQVSGAQNNMCYELQDFIRAATGEGPQDWLALIHEPLSRDTMTVMDEIRRQLSVSFPADEQ